MSLFHNRYEESDTTRHEPLSSLGLDAAFLLTIRLDHCTIIKSCCGGLHSQLQMISPAWICLQVCQESDTYITLSLLLLLKVFNEALFSSAVSIKE